MLEHSQNESTVEITTFTEEKLHNFLPQIVSLRLDIFSDYPYLYEGDEASEAKYLEKFHAMKNAIALGVFSNGNLIGEATAYPLTYEYKTLTDAFLNEGLHLRDYFCIGEVIFSKPFRGNGYGSKLCEMIESYAKIKGFSFICFFEIDRGNSDPKKPEGYRKLDSYWEKKGYLKHPELNGTVSYREKGESEESPKKMIFWIKQLAS